MPELETTPIPHLSHGQLAPVYLAQKYTVKPAGVPTGSSFFRSLNFDHEAARWHSSGSGGPLRLIPRSGVNEMISIGGPVEKVDGKLVLRIPLDAGGRELVECSRGIASVQGEYLVVVIQDWLAERLGLLPGSSVIVHNNDGRFNIQSNDPFAS